MSSSIEEMREGKHGWQRNADQRLRGTGARCRALSRWKAATTRDNGSGAECSRYRTIRMVVVSAVVIFELAAVHSASRPLRMLRTDNLPVTSTTRLSLTMTSPYSALLRLLHSIIIAPPPLIARHEEVARTGGEAASVALVATLPSLKLHNRLPQTQPPQTDRQPCQCCYFCSQLST